MSVADARGFSVGDWVSVVLDGGSSHASTLTSVSGATTADSATTRIDNPNLRVDDGRRMLTLSKGVPNAASAGNPVIKIYPQ